MIRFDYSNAAGFLSSQEITNISKFTKVAHEMLHKRNGAGSDFTGWVDHPAKYNREEVRRIRKAASAIRKNSDVLVVIGIGGSYLGARAAVEMLTHNFSQMASKRIRKAPQIIFAGNNLSSVYMADLLEVIEGKEVSVNVISKSGTTTEPAIAFRILKEYMEKRYAPDGAKKRIFATTDSSKGALKKLADAKGYETFVIPDDIGGRFSVLTAVGLLPIAVAGIDIQSMLKGAKDAMLLYRNPIPDQNDCYMYAMIRNILLRKGYEIEIMANYEPGLHFMTEWWKQLFGESEGKDGRGIFPAGVDYTTDLHSMGQYVQDGRRMVFETVINVERPAAKIEIPYDSEDQDGLNFLAGMDMDEVNKNAMHGTILAHVDGKVPNLMISIPEMTPYWFGQLVYFFEKACGISGYLLTVNPFDQPGVEAYKKNMFALLGKPGYEKEKAALEKRLK
ncbi:glucose-6-phosphate isomerase [Candidatus Nomurabacteria bacterium]|nr:glucose-6-phosphate isomerase [Candidatus Nomurabacteria bacterium]